MVLFRPHEWRGTKPDPRIPFSKQNYLTPDQMAHKINNYPGGTVIAIYLTTDGGANLQDVYDMVHSLKRRVQLVKS